MTFKENKDLIEQLESKIKKLEAEVASEREQKIDYYNRYIDLRFKGRATCSAEEFKANFDFASK
jgi:transcription elongation factor Elf1